MCTYWVLIEIKEIENSQKEVALSQIMKRIWAKICHEIQGAKNKEREVIGLSVVGQGQGGMKSKKRGEELSRSFTVYKYEDFTWVF